ncbi:MAG: hypothetical protein RL701_4142 [Pseudomonadota bacterium]
MLSACRGGEPERASEKPVAQQALVVPTPPPAAAPAERAQGWDKIRIEDTSPLCVFSDHDARDAAPFVKDVVTQKLRANARVVFGTFARACIAEACDAIPTLQCWVDSEEPSTLVVHSRLSYEHKQGTTCTEDCHPVVAGCETPALKAGKYTIKYGTQTFSLKVPSVLRAPCFE